MAASVAAAVAAARRRARSCTRPAARAAAQTSGSNAASSPCVLGTTSEGAASAPLRGKAAEGMEGRLEAHSGALDVVEGDVVHGADEAGEVG